jgi:16S rRNA (guanine527-N7)-methyltransferase
LTTDQIAALLRPFITLEAKQLAQTSIYLDLLLKWNARMNLTAVRDPQHIVTRHFGESFFMASWLLESGAVATAIDLGSGTGFPGVPLAMLAPHTRTTLIESSGKKAAFLNEVIRELKLNSVTVFHGRGEDYSPKAELVTMRAVEKFETSMLLAARLVEGGGRLAVMVGKGQVDHARSLGPELIWHDPVGLPGGHSRVLLVGSNQLPKSS